MLNYYIYRLALKINSYVFSSIVLVFTVDQMTTSSLEPYTGMFSMSRQPARYVTFKNFPVSSVVSPLQLSHAGFFYLGLGEKVRCYYCYLLVEKWSGVETPLETHRRLNPKCQYAMPPKPHSNTADCVYDLKGYINDNRSNHSEKGGNINNLRSYAYLNALDASQALSYLYDFGTHPSDKYSEYANRETRVKSFQNWKNSHIMSPLTLLDNGFFYLGREDFVRCFACGVGFGHWAKEDNVFDEHKRQNESCRVVQAGRVLPPDIDPPVSVWSTIADNLAKNASKIKKEDDKKKEEEFKNRRSCKICLNAEADSIFLPCRHIATCLKCANKLDKCPICRRAHTTVSKVFYS